MSKTVLLAGEVMAAILWNSKGVFYIDNLKKDKTVTGRYHAKMFLPIPRRTTARRSHLEKKKELLHNDNRRAPTAAIAGAALVELRWKLLPHSRYSPDWTRKTIFVTKFEKGTRWAEIWGEWGGHRSHGGVLRRQEQNVFPGGLRKLEHHWVHFIKLKDTTFRNKSRHFQIFRISLVGYLLIGPYSSIFYCYIFGLYLTLHNFLVQVSDVQW